MMGWDPILMIPQLRLNIPDKTSIPKPTWHPQQLAHEIDFEIFGDDAQYVVLVVYSNVNSIRVYIENTIYINF